MIAEVTGDSQRGLNPKLPHLRTEYCWVQAEGEECSGWQHISPLPLKMCHCVARKMSFTEPGEQEKKLLRLPSTATCKVS